MPVPVVPPPNSEVVVAVPLVVGGGFGLFPKIFPPVANGKGLGGDGFAPNGLFWVVPGAGAVEVVPNRPPPVAGVVVVVPDVVEVVPKIELAGLVPKKFPGVVVDVPVPVVPVPAVPVPVAGVVVCVVPV